MSKPLYYDPLRRVETRFHYDHSEDETIIESRTDATPIVEANLRDQAGYGPRDNELGRHVARIDTVTYHKWIQEAALRGIPSHGEEFKAFVVEKLADRDYRKLLTWHGRTPGRIVV